MQKIMNLVNDFDKLETGFWNELTSIKKMLHTIKENQEKVWKKLTQMEVKHNLLAKACHLGFIQTRDAATCLREELGEATGVMVEDTWA